MHNMFNCDLPPAPEEYRYHCILNCFRKILYFYIKENFDFHFDSTVKIKFEKKGIGVLDYNLVLSTFFPTFLDEGLNSIVIVEDNNPLSSVLEDVNILLKEEIPVVICHDSFWNDYTTFFEKAHFLHAMILCNLRKEKATIIDEDRVWNYRGEVDRSILEKSMYLEHLEHIYKNKIKLPRHLYAYISPNVKDTEYSYLIRLFISNVIGNYYRSLEQHNGMNEYFNHIKCFLLKGETDVLNFLERIGNELFDIIEYKKIFRFHFSKVIEKAEYSMLIPMYEKLAEINNNWIILRNLSMKAFFRYNNNNCFIITRQLERLSQLEIKFHEDLVKISKINNLAHI